jgi:hypothetical protein
MVDAQKKIDALRSLIGAVVRNTKAEVTGKRSSPTNEKRAVKSALEEMLGRTPTETELDSVLA